MKWASSDAEPEKIDGQDGPFTDSILATEDRRVFGAKFQISSKAENQPSDIEVIYQVGQRPPVGAAGLPLPNTGSDTKTIEQGRSNVWFAGSLSVRDGSAGNPENESGIYNLEQIPPGLGFFWEEGEEAIVSMDWGGGSTRGELFGILYYIEV